MRGREMLLQYFSLAPERRAQTRPPIVGKAVESADVRAALGRLFNGKCAFCERTSTLQPHRFRPRSNVSLETAGDEAQAYYLWLSDEWENLYPICAQCVAGSKGTDFPVMGRRAPLPNPSQIEAMVQVGAAAAGLYPPAEVSLLLDPCHDEKLSEHLAFEPNGQVIARSPRGDATIKRFSLARKNLTSRRGEAFRQRLERLRGVLASSGPSASAFEVVHQEGGEFLGAWALLLHDLAKSLQGRGPSVAAIGSPQHFEALAKRPTILASFDKALERLADAQPWGQNPTTPVPTPEPEQAMLRSVRIENFKSLENLSFELAFPAGAVATDSYAPSVMLLGENSAGKSSILEAIALALDPSILDTLKLNKGEFRLNPTFLGGEGELRTARVRLALGGRRYRTLGIGGAVVHGGTKNLPPVFGYGAYRMFARAGVGPTHAAGVATLFRPELHLPNPEQWLLGLDEKRFQLVAQTLRFILSIEADFEVIEPDPANSRCLLVQQPAGPGTALLKVPLETISSGYRSVIALACDIMQGLSTRPDFVDFESAPAIVLVDEIEAHLHPRWKMQVMSGFRRAFRQVAFIATTHDPLCLRGMGQGETVLVRRYAAEAGDLPIAVEAVIDLPSVSTLSIEQLLTSDHFGLYSTDSPEVEEDFARVADLLAKEQMFKEAPDDDETVEDLTTEEKDALARFRDNVDTALPLGASELQRMFQLELAQYLKEKRSAPHRRVQELKMKTRLAIADALSRS